MIWHAFMCKTCVLLYIHNFVTKTNYIWILFVFMRHFRKVTYKIIIVATLVIVYKIVFTNLMNYLLIV